ncbi:SH3 domain-containing protein [Listeria welshimeri]|uniref:SH3 domain-containing protein n=1 Tax=Listeria welshimeri TaxID=1643 RepID=UPI001625E13A|nr:SH3 domain-containing protein [Listeria welshimeri]MBC1282033.1 SH3 domain-containing protein [Listeria welshimeri]MBC1589872.1 SH3 domain-containing protein [Listeria welshimeri]MBC1684967.1 SH3 domain-containing protein [Listeria welshimeri]MBC1859750.1 SH3 domain-containing protein [Listeria welshimeri]MBC1949712.1 SH3 domain-containing protein [Listeria welshimeri]
MNNKRKCITTVLGLALLTTFSLSTPVLAEDSTNNSPISAETILNNDTNESIYTPKEQTEAEKKEAEAKPTEDKTSPEIKSRLFSNSQSLSSANQYIINQNYSNPVIEQQIKNFDRFVYKDGYGKPKGFVVHETANDNSTITSEINYMTNNWQNAFVHTFVDSSRIIQIHPTEYAVWGAGPKANPYFVQSELVREKTKEKFYKSINNDAYYVAFNLKQYGLIPVNAHNTGIGTVWSHDAVSRYLGGTTHSDPVGYFAKWGYSFNEFFDLVNYKYNELTVPDFKTYYAKSAISLRTTADWSSNILINIPEGEKVSIDENSLTQDGFYKVTYGGKTGWMKLSYFSKTPVLQTYYSASQVNLRKSASWNSSIVGTVPTNAKVTINTSTKTDNFYKVNYNGMIGWMKLNYFATKPTLEDVYAKSSINLRSAASWDSAIAYSIKEGDKASLNNTTGKDGFYQVTVNGKVGWMKESYFSKSPVLETLYASSQLNLRSKPDWNSSISATLPVNTQVQLNNTTLTNGFYQVKSNGKIGWMKRNYFSTNTVLETLYAASNINLRQSPSWDSKVVVSIPKGAKVSLNNTTLTNDFYQITYNGKTGWMKRGYFIK